jgi:hypothetical protein
MSVWYTLEGILGIKAGVAVERAVDRIVTRLNKASGPDLHAVYTVGRPIGRMHNNGYVRFSGGAFMSSDNVDELDGVIRELGVYVLAPGFVSYSYDNERGKIYVGPDEKTTEAWSKDSLQQIRALSTKLTSAHLDVLIAELTAREKRRKKVKK